ncbi:MAG: hypothetical protein MZV64_17395 [Ignavibacteriales bacterium]|nr:hypothetical protein [Ignavibacteriales bacterium]
MTPTRTPSPTRTPTNTRTPTRTPLPHKYAPPDRHAAVETGQRVLCQQVPLREQPAAVRFCGCPLGAHEQPGWVSPGRILQGSWRDRTNLLRLDRALQRFHRLRQIRNPRWGGAHLPQRHL